MTGDSFFIIRIAGEDTCYDTESEIEWGCAWMSELIKYSKDYPGAAWELEEREEREFAQQKAEWIHAECAAASAPRAEGKDV